MSEDPTDPIDKILRRVIVRDVHKPSAEIVKAQRAALKAAGYAIVVDEQALLARGEENVAGGRVK